MTPATRPTLRRRLPPAIFIAAVGALGPVLLHGTDAGNAAWSFCIFLSLVSFLIATGNA
jgi:hypothetical protein